MFCNKCGMEIPDGGRFCPSCGKDMGNALESARREPVQRKPVQREPEQKEPVRRKPVRHEPVEFEQAEYEPEYRRPAGRAKSGSFNPMLVVVPVAAVVAVVIVTVIILLIVKPWKNKDADTPDVSETTTETQEEDTPEVAENEDASEEAGPAEPAYGSAYDAFIDYAKNFDYISGLTGYYDSSFYENEYGYQAAKKNYSNVPFGYVDCFIKDFDGDGEDELLIPAIEGPDEPKLTLSMYEYDNEVKLAAAYDMEGYFELGYDWSDWLFLDYDFEGRKYICAVLDGGVQYFADGRDLGFFSCYYDGEKFVKMGSVGYACSDWGEEDPAFTDELHRCGVPADWYGCFENNFYDEVLSVTNGEKLFATKENTNDAVRADGDSMEYTKLAGYIRYYGYSDNDFTKHDDPDPSSDYVITFSSERLLTEEDLYAVPADKLRIARNEIAARHGRMFKDEELQAYFDSKDWYEGTIPADDFDTVTMLSDIERKNMDFIKQHEQ